MISSAVARRERTLEWARAFLTDVRGDLETAASRGEDLPPRLRTVHERPGHATPEYRTLAIPLAGPLAGASPEVLSDLIAGYARARSPSCLMLALEAEVRGDSGESRPVLICEARDCSGARFFLMQPYRREGGRIRWDGPDDAAWREPGEEELILDAAFEAAPEVRM